MQQRQCWDFEGRFVLSRSLRKGLIANIEGIWTWKKFKLIKFVQFSSVQFSCSVMSDSLWPHGLQHARLPCPSPTPKTCSNSCPSSQWYHPTISSLVIPFSSHLQSFPASGSFQMSQFYAKVLEFQLQHQSFQWTPRTDFLSDGMVGSPFSPRDSQESSLTPKFKSINSLAPCLPYSPTLTSIHDYWKNHSFE